MWHTFVPNGQPDWNFRAALSIPTGSAKTIKSMTLVHDIGDEGWSTELSRNNPLSKSLYPLVAYDSSGSQATVRYDQQILVPTGNSTFDLFAEVATTEFRGGKLTVVFTDGTYVSASVPRFTGLVSTGVRAQSFGTPTITAYKISVSSAERITLTLGTSSQCKLRVVCPVGVYSRTADGVNTCAANADDFKPIPVGPISQISFSNNTGIPQSVEVQAFGYDSLGRSVGGASVYISVSAGSLPQTNDTDLVIRGVRISWTNPATLNLNVCVNGSKSINDIKRIDPRVTGFPFYFIVYDSAGTAYPVSQNGKWDAAGGVEELKNGQCMENLGTAIQTWQVPAFKQSGKVLIKLDPNNFIPETNEANNDYLFVTGATQPSITVLSPNGGDVWQAGSSLEIKWRRTNISNGQYVEKINLLRNNSFYGEISKSNIIEGGGTVEPNENSTLWRVGNITICGIPAEKGTPNSNDYKIQVQLFNNAGTLILEDSSNALFSITSGTTQPSITVLSPNGGESFAQGNILSGSYTTSKIPYGTFCEIAIVGRKPDGSPVDSTIATGNIIASDRQSFSGTIPSNLVPPGIYRIRVDCGGSTLLAQDQSDSYFTITSSTQTNPSITLTSPNGGQTFKKGDRIPIYWTSSNISAGSIIDIFLQDRTNVTKFAYIAQNDSTATNDGSFIWTIPDSVQAGNYSIRVLCRTCAQTTGEPAHDWSDSQFTIAEASTISAQGAPTVTLTSPNGGGTYTKGSVLPIRWTSTNISSDSIIDIFLQDRTSVTNFAYISQNNATTKNSGSFNWTIPASVAPRSYSVRVLCRSCAQSTAEPAFDWSDAQFNITEALTTGQSANPSLNQIANILESSRLLLEDLKRRMR